MGALAVVGILVAVILGLGLIWRYAYFCPSWLVPLLENPYVEAVAGAALLVDRAGIRPGMRVLDAGCGPGRMTLPMAAAVGETGRVVAVDLQTRMLEKLRRRLDERGVGNVTTLQAGLGAGKLPAAAFDRAVLVTVLGEVPDPVATLREIRGALAPGGVLSVTEVIPDPHYQSVRRMRELIAAAGLHEAAFFPGLLSYTINLAKDVDS